MGAEPRGCAIRGTVACGLIDVLVFRDIPPVYLKVDAPVALISRINII